MVRPGFDRRAAVQQDGGEEIGARYGTEGDGWNSEDREQSGQGTIAA